MLKLRGTIRTVAAHPQHYILYIIVRGSTIRSIIPAPMLLVRTQPSLANRMNGWQRSGRTTPNRHGATRTETNRHAPTRTNPTQIATWRSRPKHTDFMNKLWNQTFRNNLSKNDKNDHKFAQKRPQITCHVILLWAIFPLICWVFSGRLHK